MKKLWKKTVVIWAETCNAADLAAQEAIEVARGGAVETTVAYGLPAKRVQPENDPDFDPSVQEAFE